MILQFREDGLRGERSKKLLLIWGQKEGRRGGRGQTVLVKVLPYPKQSEEVDKTIFVIIHFYLEVSK